MRTLLLEHHPYDGAIQVGSHQIARELLRRGHRVVWLRHPRSGLHRVLGPLPPPLSVHPDGVREVALRAPLPYLRAPLLGSAWWGRRWLAGAGRQLAGLGVDARFDLLWISDFTAVSLLGTVTAPRVVMRFFDRLDAFRWTPGSLFDLVAERLGQVDLVLASSRGVQADLARRGIPARYLPNGIDLGRVPEEAAVDRPRARRVVYVGAIDDWFDLPAVEHWARRLPDVDFEIIGPCRRGLSSSPPNLRLVGPVAYETVPERLLAAHCGIIPFRLGPLTSGVHPLKLYEYLAAGCPVLAADLPEVVADGVAVVKYRDRQEGLELLRGLLDRPVDRRALRRRVLDHGWDRRLDRVGELLGCPL